MLCLSCPDDEAITFLGLGEGIANLPQLFLHPVALIIVALICVFVLHSGGDLRWCGNDKVCEVRQLASVSVVFIMWVMTALGGGILGAAAVALLFGLGLGDACRALVSRVLVSYVPLKPAECLFRGISGLNLGWGNPLQLMHSAIYRSSDTTKAIAEWLREDTPSKLAMQKQASTTIREDCEAASVSS